MAKSFGLADTTGALVQEVTAKGPAEASGVKRRGRDPVGQRHQDQGHQGSRAQDRRVCAQHGRRRARDARATRRRSSRSSSAASPAPTPRSPPSRRPSRRPGSSPSLGLSFASRPARAAPPPRTACGHAMSRKAATPPPRASRAATSSPTSTASRSNTADDIEAAVKRAVKPRHRAAHRQVRRPHRGRRGHGQAEGLSAS